MVDMWIREKARQANLVRSTERLPAENCEGSGLPVRRLLRELQ